MSSGLMQPFEGPVVPAGHMSAARSSGPTPAGSGGVWAAVIRDSHGIERTPGRADGVLGFGAVPDGCEVAGTSTTNSSSGQPGATSATFPTCSSAHTRTFAPESAS